MADFLFDNFQFHWSYNDEFRINRRNIMEILD